MRTPSLSVYIASHPPTKRWVLCRNPAGVRHSTVKLIHVHDQGHSHNKGEAYYTPPSTKYDTPRTASAMFAVRPYLAITGAR